MSILKQARKAAFEVLKKDPDLKKSDHAKLKTEFLEKEILLANILSMVKANSVSKELYI